MSVLLNVFVLGWGAVRVARRHGQDTGQQAR